MTSWKDPNKSARYMFRHWPAWLVLATGCALAVTAIGAVGLVLTTRGALSHSARLVNGAAPQGPERSPHPLGEDHALALRDHGVPQAFTLLFYEEVGAPVRAETWTYYREGLEIDFVDGELQRERAINAASGEIVPAPYRPDQFAAFMSLPELLASAQINDYFVMPLEEELVAGGEIYYADEIMFGMKDGRLRYVQVLALEAQE
ncbi:MAG: hypothetical protein A2Z30_02205 [Chloroflexi bacterium RBG_16_64_43]|nr:MAG: hypothetical protein A2Z30_02205 [Chloroflexi bacterium RBG_16_64_43]